MAWWLATGVKSRTERASRKACFATACTEWGGVPAFGQRLLRDDQVLVTLHLDHPVTSSWDVS